MKILVTGATGFIGSEVVSQLLDLGHEVIATASRDKESINSFKWHKDVIYIQKDLRNYEDNFYQFFLKPDIVIHLAWHGLPNYKEYYHIENNMIKDYFMIKNFVENGLSNITIAGTCFEYGMQNGCLPEYLETKPITCYGVAKDSLRRFIELLSLKYQFIYKWARIFYPYGEGQNPKSLYSQLLQSIANKDTVFNMSGGEQLRDFIPKEKVAEYLIKIALQDKINGVINCCSGKPISVRSFVEKFYEEHNYKIKLNLGYYPYPDYEPMAYWGNISKLKKILEMV